MSKKAAIYLRVSTSDQSVESQRGECLRAAGQRGLEPVFFEDVASGAKFSRKSLDEMMSRVRRREFEAVICYKLDRLGRSLPHLAQLVMELDSNKVGLVACSQGIDTTSSNPVARMQMHVLMAVAEFERDMIRERTNAGLAVARSKGVRLGRPKGPASSRKFNQMIACFESDPNRSASSVSRELGVSLTTVCRWKRKWELSNKVYPPA